ncbi:hypothetical protein SDC49_13900 [Lactobacillus sp. R2/2]|nr:hypothetical protein [Lactobacillus sp. R2/2]
MANQQINAAEKQLATQKAKLNTQIAQAKNADTNLPATARMQLEQAQQEITTGEQKLQQEKGNFPINQPLPPRK